MTQIQERDKTNNYYRLPVNVIVTFEEEEQLIETLDVAVNFNLYPLNRELDCLNQIMTGLMQSGCKPSCYMCQFGIEGNGTFTNNHGFKRDYSRLVKLSLCYYFPNEAHDEYGIKEHKVDKRWDFIGRVNSKYYFQPDQRDLIEESLMKRFSFASNTAAFKDFYNKEG